MATSGDGQMTVLLERVRRGESDALSTLFAIVYAELRVLARRQLAGHKRGTLSTTAVVHEAYLKLLSPDSINVVDRRHFFALAARAMRQILVDHARMHLAKKRGQGKPHQLLTDDAIVVDARAEKLLDLNLALERLNGVDPRLAQIVDLRFFAGCSVDETAELMDISSRTVKRDWRKARAFLYNEVGSNLAHFGTA